MNKNLVNTETDKKEFDFIYNMIHASQEACYRQINSDLIKLYWNIGKYVTEKIAENQWGKSTVTELSLYILAKHTGIKGFSARNIWRMKQFYETYVNDSKLSPLVTVLSWTNHLQILSKTKTTEERAYYLTLCAQHHYSKRALERLIDSGTYERTLLANQKLSAALTEFPVDTRGVFKDSYVFEFLNLQEDHLENDLRKALVRSLKQFLFELGPDFTMIGEEYVLQVGNKDFKIDLLLFHRGLNAMIALELKTVEFHPSHLGQLQFYLEALDKDIKKTHENPTIGILICKTKDDEVVKYALNRHASPTMIAEYETKLINKDLLQRKVHEISQRLPWDEEGNNNREEN